MDAAMLPVKDSLKYLGHGGGVEVADGNANKAVRQDPKLPHPQTPLARSRRS